MCIVYTASKSTRDLGAFFRPVKAVRDAARRVAARDDIPEDWLNDGAIMHLK